MTHSVNRKLTYSDTSAHNYGIYGATAHRSSQDFDFPCFSSSVNRAFNSKQGQLIENHGKAPMHHLNANTRKCSREPCRHQERTKRIYNGSIQVENMKENLQQCHAPDDETHFSEMFPLLTETAVIYCYIYRRFSNVALICKIRR